MKYLEIAYLEIKKANNSIELLSTKMSNVPR